MLPSTNFHLTSPNPAEKLFWGRLPACSVTSQYYFTKDSAMQRIMHQFKYKGHKELGYYMGRLMGRQLLYSRLFTSIEIIIPLPLHRTREKIRGYNQAAILSSGISEIIRKPVITDAVIRNTQTDSQTRKNRIERWQNMEDKFKVQRVKELEGRHVLLVDDVLTTGATLESCGRTILQIPNTSLSIATLCISSGN
jgi:ComF family protein